MTEQTIESTSLRHAIGVVLLTGPRSDRSLRAGAYYDRHGCRWQTVDVTSNDDRQAAIRQAVDKLGTPYVVLADEHDFLLPDALDLALQYLQAHPHEIMAQGHLLAYQPGRSEVAYFKVGEAADGEDGSGALARLRRHAQASLQAWRAVVRAEAFTHALNTAPGGNGVEHWLLGLSWALLLQGPCKVLGIASSVVEQRCTQSGGAAHEQVLAQIIRELRQADSEHQGICAGEEGYAVLRLFVRNTHDAGQGPLLFTSQWTSVIDDPQRRFEPRQYVELPYYSASLHKQLSALEFLLHAWPVGQAHTKALEGVWVQQRELLQEHAGDTPQSLQERYWQALSLNLFDRHVCSRLRDSLGGKRDEEQIKELDTWVKRLGAVSNLDLARALDETPSGQVLRTIAGAAPSAAETRRIQAHLARRKAPELAFVVLDAQDDDAALQRTFDSIVASGMRGIRIVVLKAGTLPAITAAKDTLHFIKVTSANLVAHLNQLLRQMPSEWLMLLRAGDQVTAGGVLRAQVELAEQPPCLAICGNEVQRSADQRLLSIIRPGADIDLLRSRSGLMAGHWLIKRDALVEMGGYREAAGRALELDVLLRMIEQHGVGCLGHVDEYLVIGDQPEPAQADDETQVVNRHLVQLGYNPQLAAQGDGCVQIDYRHGATPLVSILIADEGDHERLRACLTSVLQRTRYPRYEVLVACERSSEDLASLVQGCGARVRLLETHQAASTGELLNLAAANAQGEQLVLLSAHCQVVAPAWLEALLNQAQRPEVGVVGSLLVNTEAMIVHAGYQLLAEGHVYSPWQGKPVDVDAVSPWIASVRSCQAVSGSCLMVRRELFEHCSGLQAGEGQDIDLCLRAAQAGMLVLWTPHARMLDLSGITAAPQLPVLCGSWPEAFVSRAPLDAGAVAQRMSRSWLQAIA
ncbi:glycosyltransferase [Pseudomonas sp. UFMG81]|uniref:glycosyltransferase n=1 Tax=Pseudomonas sp. UFMG81 TaxID=2745936 RepID=UPI001890130A|nr:glycosyltransferase [Pseudomonas sp. UFMG81]